MALTGSSRGAYGEESPEALRRRAEVLLDEMMLGGIDTGAAGPQGGASAGTGSAGSGNGNGAAHWPQAGEAALEYDGAGHGPNGSNDAGGDSLGSVPAGGEPMLPRGANSRLVSAEERYAQLAGVRPASVEPPSVSPVPNGLPPTAAPSGLTASGAEARAEAPAPQAAAYQADYAADYAAGSYGAGAAGGSPAVRRQSPSLASQMSVGVRAANRSNLLPRNNEIDADTVQGEINELLRAVATALPPGNEAVERSRHLLSKAQTLLQSAPTRTAEVDYYLQQVRRIVQRTQQTAQWSSLYQQRLTIYLWAWLLLGSMIVAAVALSTGSVIEFFTQLVGMPELELLIWQAPVLLAGMFAGALGASLSALFNMQRRRRREHAYFDRKYGLRGLLLPLLGMFFGLLLALLAALVYVVAEVNPASQASAVAAPAVLALVVGFGQEWMYGARI